MAECTLPVNATVLSENCTTESLDVSQYDSDLIHASSDRQIITDGVANTSSTLDLAMVQPLLQNNQSRQKDKSYALTINSFYIYILCSLPVPTL